MTENGCWQGTFSALFSAFGSRAASDRLRNHGCLAPYSCHDIVVGAPVKGGHLLEDDLVLRAKTDMEHEHANLAWEAWQSPEWPEGKGP